VKPKYSASNSFELHAAHVSPMSETVLGLFYAGMETSNYVAVPGDAHNTTNPVAFTVRSKLGVPRIYATIADGPRT